MRIMLAEKSWRGSFDRPQTSIAIKTGLAIRSRLVINDVATTVDIEGAARFENSFEKLPSPLDAGQ